jgi:hypothetical protein
LAELGALGWQTNGDWKLIIKGDVMKERFAGRTLAFSLFACLVALFLCVAIAGAQTAGTGAIAGTVTDPTGAIVPNVKVTSTSKATNQSRTATTGADGVYKFSLLPPRDQMAARRDWPEIDCPLALEN